MSLSLDPLRPYADLTRWAAGLLLALLVLAFGYRWGGSHWRGEYQAEVQARATENAQHAALLQQLAVATAAVAAKARAASTALAADRQANDTRFKKAQDDANRAERDLAAALRRGSVQLRPEWACAAAGAGAGGAAVFTAGQDAASELRWAGATHLVAGGDRADAWIGWLQQELIDTRQAVIAAGCAIEAPDR
ncbi:MAG: hypothetical protein J0I01_05740 [Stenotrophomonas nitritireducens]|uniref:hypothetical protein n=1 Tax=Stenotrophomonas nitritireducens TaxID=83617 RepID=UPI001ACD3464|nr:hypothetical protein [Stenotrophomonas nitritireducens]MBN8791714.1 hypothetical protein [Stenotrophomonas nitritireducens]MBN8795652.1 hypothetical protein [Stenotrophomonas nitritireducens]